MRARWLLLAALAGCGDSSSTAPEDLSVSLDQAALDQSVPDLRLPPIDGCIICPEDLQGVADLNDVDLATGEDLSRPQAFADLGCAQCDGGVCDPLTGQCAVCSSANDTCPDGQHCTRNEMFCMSGVPDPCPPQFVCVSSDKSCGPNGCCRMPCTPSPGGPLCYGGFVCVPSADCPPTGCCVPPTGCQPGCKSDAECRASAGDGGTSFTRCCNGQCVDSANDQLHCGTCGISCAASGTFCCCGLCTTPSCGIEQTDPNNCGACGHVCGSGQACVNGNCQ